MTIVSVPKNVWTLITTASADTIVENLGHSEVFFLKEVPTLSSQGNRKLTITTLGVGEPLYVYSVNKATEVRHF
jgi:hypothetical protein